MVHNWLSDENNGRWTMVVDNADDEQVMLNSRKSETDSEASATVLSDRSLADYLPSSSNGSVVITTRNRKVAEGLIEYAEDILDLGPMDVDVAVVFLTKKLKKLEGMCSRDDLTDLARQVDCMPLAMSQAAAYLNQRAPRMSLSKYLWELRSSDEGRARLLQADIRDPRRDGKSSNSIMTTWYVSYEHIQHTHNSAARLLSLMSLFDREGIPDHLLRRQYLDKWPSENEDKDQTRERQSEMDFEDDVATLRMYSLIGTGINEQLFEMHRLVQFSVRKWLEIRDELKWWQRRYVDVLEQRFPFGDYENWSTCQALFPHVQMLISYSTNEASFRQKRAVLLYRAAQYATDHGLYGIAEMMAGISVAEREVVLGKDGTRTLSSMNILASVWWHQGKYKQAEEMHRQALTEREKLLGVNHESTFMSMNELALVLGSQGKYEQSEPMFRRVLAGLEKVLGADHLRTLTAMNNLGVVLEKQGKYEQAEEMHRRALTEGEKVLGVDHPHTLICLNNLGVVLRKQGKYKQAEEMHRRTLTGGEKILGTDNPATLTVMNNLGLVLTRQGKDEQAEEMHRRTLAGREKVLGIDDPATLKSLDNLATVVGRQGEYEQAEEMYRRALVGKEKVLGVEHLATLKTVSNLAWILLLQNRHEESDEMIRRTLVGREKVLGVDHPDTLLDLWVLADAAFKKQDLHEALKLYDRATNGLTKALGAEHPSTLTCLAERESLLEKMNAS
ncbi:hypothetical protein EDD36DRAFT_446781 [Exophiala viscosa]|uniref:DUF7779 domain-containing protein n=2 Tax=Exophiala viscosa TaxID=2486360 RepID=A0AAN6DPJ5_9EURO|nr:hypothetical protein EDD36DRAFT_446781 [Exophiala viscosa]